MLPKIKRFERFSPAGLYAYKGGDKPKRQKVYATPTEYDNVTSSTFGGPFGEGSSSIDKTNGTINATATLTPELQAAADVAQSGLTSNLGYINRNPQEQVAYATGGQDPVYNVLAEQARMAFDDNLGRLRLQAFKGGGLNSTAAGAAYGDLAYKKNLYDNQILQSAIAFGNQQASQNAQTNLGAMGGLAQLVYPLESAANAQLNTALQANDRADAATTQAKNQAEAAYQQAMNEYNAQKNAGMGSGIGSLIGAGAALVAAPFTGGASLAFLPMAASLGGTAGGMIQGQPTQYSGGGGMPYMGGGYNFGSSGGYAPGGIDLSGGLPQINPYYTSPSFGNLSMAVA